MTEFFPFFIIIFSGVFFAMIFRRFHIPWVVSLIVGGIIMGPQVLGILTINNTVEFLGEIGLVFLMFMAGLETNLSSFKKFRGRFLALPLINGLVPMGVGLAIGFYFGYGLIPSILIGIIFLSSSIAVVIPSLEHHGLLHTMLGKSVVITSIIEDTASLILLSLLLQTLEPVAALPLYLFYPLLFLILIMLRWLLPKIRQFSHNLTSKSQTIFQQDFRSVFAILIGTVIIFELLGLHAIIAGFFAGLVLSDSIRSDELISKIRTISYGIFIPIFFTIIGAKTNILAFKEADGIAILVVVLIAGSILAKFASGWLGARIVGFTHNESLLFGVSTIPQLSTTLAVAFTALSLGYIDERLITAMVALSIISTITSPLLMEFFGSRLKK